MPSASTAIALNGVGVGIGVARRIGMVVMAAARVSRWMVFMLVWIFKTLEGIS
jgi:hypothetical protein